LVTQRCRIRRSCTRQRHYIRRATLRFEIEITGEKEARSMLRSLIAWSVGNPLIVLLGVAVLIGAGAYSFINVEAYPDPAPAIIAEPVTGFAGEDAEAANGSPCRCVLNRARSVSQRPIFSPSCFTVWRVASPIPLAGRNRLRCNALVSWRLHASPCPPCGQQ